MIKFTKHILRKVFWKLFKVRIFEAKGSFFDDNPELKPHMTENIELGKEINLNVKKDNK